MNKKPYNFEDRIVEFAANIIALCKTLPNDQIGKYYFDQMLRSSGSAALHYGEAQGTVTAKDFIHKMANTAKELKETRVALKIITKANIGDPTLTQDLISESNELIAISTKMILNKKRSPKINTPN